MITETKRDVWDEQAATMDWGQVVANGGPPCFFVEGSQYCGRAKRWGGHGNPAFHDYISLEALIHTATAQESAN